MEIPRQRWNKKVLCTEIIDVILSLEMIECVLNIKKITGDKYEKFYTSCPCSIWLFINVSDDHCLLCAYLVCG